MKKKTLAGKRKPILVPSGHPIKEEIKKKISLTKTNVFRSSQVPSRAYQARKTWEQFWSESVPNGYVIHHVDRDIHNNRIHNLALLTRATHNRIHLKSRYGNIS